MEREVKALAWSLAAPQSLQWGRAVGTHSLVLVLSRVQSQSEPPNFVLFCSTLPLPLLFGTALLFIRMTGNYIP